MTTLKVGIFKYSSGPRRSNRSDAEMNDIANAAGSLWAPAGIQFDCDEVQPYPINHRNIYEQIDELNNQFMPSAAVDLVVFFLPRPSFQGKPVNGLNPGDSRIVLVSDSVKLRVAKPPPEPMILSIENTLKATARVCAHEIGHVLLGPAHASNPMLLMFQGSTGVRLTAASKTVAKTRAEEIISLR